MKMKLLALLAVVAATGCSTSWIEGGGIKAHNTRWFWSSTDFTAELPTTNGASLKVGLKSSNADSQSLGAVAEGVARGLSKP
jgi:hypothetical protein